MASPQFPPALIARMLLRETFEGGRLFRIVHVDDSGNRIWLFDVNDTVWPVSYERAALEAQFLSEPPAFVIEYIEPFDIRRSNEELTDKTPTDRAHLRAWTIVQRLTEAGGDRKLLFDIGRRQRIDSAVTTFGVSRPTVVTALMRYWQRGMTSDALRPDYANCGGPGKERNAKDGRKLGRPRKITRGVGISVTEDLRRKMRVGIDYYLSKRKPSQQEALDRIVQLFFSHHEHRDSRTTVTVSEDKPTLAQFRYYLNNFKSLNERFKARQGRKKFEKEAREIGGKGDQNTHGPGDKFQIDATIADVYLRSQFDRRRIVGRPVIYFIIDVWSRLIVGVYVGFEGPSWIGAMMALTNMVTPKKEYCRQYEVEIEEEDWPSHQAPRTILADKGELMSVRLGQRIVDKLGIQIENAASGRPDLKGIIEARFRVVPSIFKQFTPGYVEPDFGDRGSEDYRLDAAMDLNDFTKIVIYAILQHNRETVDGLVVPTEMTTEGLEATPLNLWSWGIRNRSGSLRHIRLDDVALAVMPTGSARVTEKGIHFHGGFYSCEAAEAGGWFSRARQKGSWLVDVSYDPRSLEKLYIWDPKSKGGYEPCWLKDAYSDLEGKSLYEYEEKERAAKHVAAAGADARQAKRIETDIQMQKIEAKARAETESVRDPDASKASQVSGIRNNRGTEKLRQRKIEQFDLAPTIQPALPQPPAELDDEADTHEQDMLSRLTQIADSADTREK